MIVSGNFNFAAEMIYLDVVPYDKRLTVLTLHTPVGELLPFIALGLGKEWPWQG